jgi:prephenate dehydrogenase
MGRWFARFLERDGHLVHVSGRKTGMDIPALAQRSQVVVVSVPISVTGQVIQAVGPHMRGDSLLMDLTSLKAKPVSSMLEWSASEVIGMHPLFGPSARSMRGKNIVICPARGKRWLPWLRETLSRHGARLMETTPERHDELMAVVQGLTHLNTLTMGLVLTRMAVSPLELRGLSTPMLQTKLAMIRKVFRRNPRLYAEIIALNPHAEEILRQYEGALEALRRPIQERSPAELMRLMAEAEALGK